jgi:hypothetical protein
MYVTPVTIHMTKHINVNKLTPNALQRHLVPKIGLGIVINATGLFSVKCFQNYLTLRVKGKLVLSVETSVPKFQLFVTLNSKHESLEKFSNYYNKKQPSGHYCYVAPLKPSKLSDKYVYVFFDTECTCNAKRSMEFVGD